MAKKQISATKIGKKVTIVIGEETLSKSIALAKDRKEVLDLVEAFNKRNSKAKEAQIRKLMEKKSRAKVGKEKQKSRELERAAKDKKAEKKVDTTTERKAKAQEAKAKTVTTTTTRRRYGGEY